MEGVVLLFALFVFIGGYYVMFPDNDQEFKNVKKHCEIFCERPAVIAQYDNIEDCIDLCIDKNLED